MSNQGAERSLRMRGAKLGLGMENKRIFHLSLSCLTTSRIKSPEHLSHASSSILYELAQTFALFSSFGRGLNSRTRAYKGFSCLMLPVLALHNEPRTMKKESVNSRVKA